jgi:ribulose-5-phosphate 4-epimerase/fuculose-1-phosphate aldolase
MNPYWLTFAESVCSTARMMDRLGLTAGTSGNISMRVPGQSYAVITPSGMPYQSLTPNDMTVIDLAGQQVAGIHPASSETPLHAHLYSVFESIHAVVHTHSLYATAFSVVRKPIPLVSLEGLGVNSLNVPVAEYALPGTSDLAISAELALRSNPGVQAILLPNHGLVTIGAALEDAFSLAINVEREAQILAIASSLGTPVQLTASQLSQINATYAAMHAKTA